VRWGDKIGEEFGEGTLGNVGKVATRDFYGDL